MGIVVLTVVIIGVTMLVMAVGVIFSNRCLRGSCGGPDIHDAHGEPLYCDHCPNRPVEIDSEQPG